MTEYWVSQGNKWCDYCKIYIANNATSIRTHEFGQRHKDNVAKKLAAIRKDNAVKEKEKQQAVKDLERIEAQARKSYERDLASIRRADAAAEIAYGHEEDECRSTGIRGTSTPAEDETTKDNTVRKNGGSANDWTYDEATGYHFNAATGYYYDPNSGLYYSDILGKWTTQEAALKASEEAQSQNGPEPVTKKQSSGSTSQTQAKGQKVPLKTVRDSSKKSTPGASMALNTAVGKAPGPVRVGKGVASSLDIGKRKREERTGPISGEEAAALAAREAARKRTQEREKSLLGLYQAY